MVGLALKRRHIGWGVVALFVTICTVIAGGALYVWYGMSIFGECKTVVRGSIPSPDGSKSVVVVRQECGATVPYNTQASIAPAGDSFSPGKRPAFFVISGTPEVIVTWLGETAVEIALIPGGGKVFKSEQSVGDIKVTYK